MTEWRSFTGFSVALLLFFSSHFCDLKMQKDNQHASAEQSRTAAAAPEKISQPVHNQGLDTIPSTEPDHDYLNNVDWELRQPLDLSTATIITTANSTADRVHFIYNCDDNEQKTTAIPAEGMVSDSIDWACDSIITTKMIAVGTDTTVEYSYQIDLTFLNTLDP